MRLNLTKTTPPATYNILPGMLEIRNCQGGRRYFSRREITALVGGPGNMVVYRHILVIPPTAKVVTVEKRKTAYHQNITSVLHYRRKNTAIYFVLPLPPKKYRRKVPPALNTAKRVPPTLDTAQKVPPTLDTAPRHRVHTGYRPKCTGRSFRVRFLFFVLPGSSSSFSVEPLCVCVDRETPPHLPMHLPPHLPTPRSAWSSRTMSGLEGNRSATNSGVAGSSTSSSVEVGSVAS